MILFDLLVSQNIVKVPTNSLLTSKHTLRYFKSRRSLANSPILAYAVKESAFLIETKKSLAEKKFFCENYWQKLVNTVWREVIFMSVFDKSSVKYIIELSHLNTYRDQDSGKNLVSKFSKSLLEGSIASSFSSTTSNHDSLFAIQYELPKCLKVRKGKILNLFNLNSHEEYLKCAKEYLNCNTALNHFPLFVVSNYLGQMIISEPSNELMQKRNFWTHVPAVNTLSQFHQGWFFTSLNDAQEYMESINEQYGLQKNHLKVFVCDFAALYNITDKFGHRVHFRLMPDLKEVSSLVKSYRRYHNISFHTKQKHGTTYFQGQPIYIIKSEGGRSYSRPFISRYLEKYNLVFTNYETACSVLKKMNSKSLDARFKMPNVTVYNLESFIKDEIFAGTNQVSSYLLVPSQNSYWFTKGYFLQKKTSFAYTNIVSCISLVKLWSKRILWSLTSKQPYGW